MKSFAFDDDEIVTLVFKGSITLYGIDKDEDPPQKGEKYNISCMYNFDVSKLKVEVDNVVPSKDIDTLTVTFNLITGEQT